MLFIELDVRFVLSIGVSDRFVLFIKLDVRFVLSIGVSMTGFLSLCSSFPRAKFPQEVYCTIESWGDTHKRSVCLKSISGLLNH